MKIIYCIHGLKNSGGMERVISTKANYLAENYDYNVIIVTLNESDVSFFNLSKLIQVKKFSVKSLHLLRDYVNREAPDFFISTGGKEISILPSLSSGIQRIVEIHFCFYFPILREISAGRGFFYKTYGTLKLLRYIFFLNFADVVVSLTSKDSSKWKIVLPCTKTRTIGNPVPFISSDQFLKPLSENNSLIRFIAIGRLDNQKGFNDLLDICSSFKDKYKSEQWLLEIYGGGELKSSLLFKIEKLGLHKNIIIHDPVEDLALIYQSSTALLMTSYYEGMPMVLLEALSFGIPCIAFDCNSGPSELINDGVNGFLIQNRSKPQFMSKMLDVVEMNAESLNEMRIHSLRKAENYKIDKVMKEWNELFICKQ